ncbi:MAG: putative endonuclease [Patescibacteria group bacterium]|jgi:Holliday junction resolvase-like predicted endonuclease|nr:putative endonuclease [Patescibacteria group bacterium]
MLTPKRRFGDLGELLAARFLMKHGFSIIEKNYWKPWGEIDIVAERLEAVPARETLENGSKSKMFLVKPRYKEVLRVLHFVEVKTVSCVTGEGGVSRENIRPEENMHYHKIRRFSRAVQTYMDERRVSCETPFQVDLVTVRIDYRKRVGRVEMLEKIF